MALLAIHHLDFKNQHLLLDKVRALTVSKRLLTLLTLHDPFLAARYRDHLVMMKNGRVHRHGATQSVVDTNTLESMYGMKMSVETSTDGNAFVVPTTDAGQSAIH
ncbi:ABC transporter ATP-binding protein [Desulfosarcina ovata]|uniref:ABC transporter ATP-binding protein n=1 Tax=Desulfosarcina ovata TaxID=83564 RepID=UPI0012D2C98F|nr:ABC transporter ATP-binding protein [Desulfosarcina ovata]